MEEDRPLNDTQEAPDNREPLPTMTMRTPDNGDAKRSISSIMIVGVVLIISLLVAGLFLPPVSLAQRLGLAGSDREGVEDPAAASETPVEGLALHLQDSSAEVSINAVTRSDFAADESTAAMAAALPETADVRSSVFLINYEGQAPLARIAIDVPADASATETLDLYGWNGQEWAFIPLESSEAGQWESVSLAAPQAVALMQTAAPDDAVIAAEVRPTEKLPGPVLPYLNEVVAGTLTLAEDGTLEGDVADVPQGGYRQYVHATNTGVVVDQGALATLLTDDALLDEHVEALQQAAASYAGLNLDYQGVLPEHSAAYTTLVTRLAEALHAQDKLLLVTLQTPMALEDGEWDTGGQEWQAIGRAADVVYVQMPLDPAAYGDEGKALQLVQWAVRQIHRHKINLLVSTNAVDAVGGAYRELPNATALEKFGELSVTDGAETVPVGTSVEVGLAGSAGPLEWDGGNVMYRYTYQQADQEHTVWLNNGAALSYHMRFAAPFHLRGVSLRGLDNAAEGSDYARAIESYLNATASPEPAGAAIVWTVEDEAESVVASSSGESLSYRWEDTEKPGSYTINANFAQGEEVAKLGSLTVEVEEATTPTPTPEPTATPEAQDEQDEAQGVAAAAPTSTPAAPVAELDPGQADAVNNIASNFRRGPGLGYGVIEVLPAGTQLSLIGRNAAADWLQVRVVDGGTEGWLFSNLLTVNEGVDVNALPVVEVDPPTVGDDPAPAPPPPIANTGFELGGQTHTLANPTLMQQAGMNWVKFQHKWGPGDSPDAVAGRIGHAHGNGFKVLLSIPGANAYPSSIDFNAYVEFLRGVAALGPDAIEIWNEMNIDFEWPAGQIDPNSYVNNMLRPAYQAIKSVNPNVMVISGAPAPTGYDNGTNAWADDRYMAGVAAAGGANYMDCIGVHHNAGATPPNATSGHPAGSNHYSWYFQPTLNMYYNAFGGSRPVCFTELGYLSGQDFGGVPSRFSWASGTTVSQHAQWLGQAVSIAGNSGKVRMVIVFNVDFTHWGDDPQAGFAMLRPDGSCPACATLSAAMGQ